ncbi:MAG: hypothetical protein A2268_09165 [Candidatus Raymondbacteria bacterium RifOxyA12_full_50_37]|uniref:FlgD/Vpr Ig-like domain-containing protein n=1 Tax=Candidatus Raymondbacteria bacterium RIFOXYD12_FULL_49_13 TaxID=1817890 RepID=A0A1F7FGM7_UNCRA|nr:MAG: hypothetical protein A2350_01255 [Candidatus Raymondbacteria bacterium RifOxyB12_full_50_8]OGJ90332.1 MAG: hypothetical protein A2268_09165 [Candidatus Raymondbacteria bacterium RifOxyA12_full_50_37]OGJ93097.1 MAG: hypothetical protein A2248_13515 [Candidatus Raymondbacteria bacterium RIFOXYA2_FULL_49_16]OGJ99249.1 MAG: hypothetical protein A2453_05025 [Candidatus Raymondbacteria bacterium RIFOXYC2_FULL_50_21]OGJ99973.1 MAG: hypothetical protein A2487_17130 [Candidatus Raymondbacteria b
MRLLVLLAALLLVSQTPGRLRNPWIVVDHDLNFWSITKSTQTHDHFPDFPAFDRQNPDQFLKTWHDSICVGEARCNKYDGFLSDWGGDCLYARKNEYFAHDGKNYKEAPFPEGLQYAHIYDPMKFFNCFGYGYCMFIGEVSCNYYTMLGYEARQWSLKWNAHRVCDVYYNDGWHWFDWDEGWWTANASGNTYGLDFATTNTTAYMAAPQRSVYIDSVGWGTFIQGALARPEYLFFGSMRGGGADMSFALRIGEKIERFYNPLDNTYFHPNTDMDMTRTPKACGNSRITYEPTLGDVYADFLDGIYEQSNATLVADGVTLDNGSVTWAIRSPYVIYSSNVSMTSTGSLTTQVSYDLGVTWADYTDSLHAQQRYDYLLKVSGTGKITALKVVTIGQLNPGALPTLRQGTNNCRLYLYDNDETLTLLPDWRTSAGFNKHVVDVSGFTWLGTDNMRNGGKTNSSDSGDYITMELTGPATGSVVSASGYFTINRLRRQENFIPYATNTLDILTGNSMHNLAVTTTAPSPMHTALATMQSTLTEYGFGHWAQAINFERDPISTPGNKGYIQCKGQEIQLTQFRECELYMHYYINHLDQDYLNDLIIKHIYNSNETTIDSVISYVSAEEIASSNGIIDYEVTYPTAFVKDPSHCIVMEVAGGVLLTDLEQNPLVSQIKELGNDKNDGVCVMTNIPNPFNPLTVISFSIKQKKLENMTLAVYDTKGALVKVLTQGLVSSGNMSVSWDGRNMRGADAASGTYMVRLKYGNTFYTHRIVLIR